MCLTLVEYVTNYVVTSVMLLIAMVQNEITMKILYAIDLKIVNVEYANSMICEK